MSEALKARIQALVLEEIGVLIGDYVADTESNELMEVVGVTFDSGEPCLSCVPMQWEGDDDRSDTLHEVAVSDLTFHAKRSDVNRFGTGKEGERDE